MAEEKETTVPTNNEEPDFAAVQFEGVLSTLSTFKTQITALQQQIRAMEKTMKSERKKLCKDAAKNKYRGNRKPSGFAKPTKISEELCKFMSKEEGTEVARTEVTQFIIKYISENKLQNPDNRRIIMPDEQLKTLLSIKDNEEVNYFNIQKFMNKHFHSKAKQEEHAPL